MVDLPVVEPESAEPEELDDAALLREIAKELRRALNSPSTMPSSKAGLAKELRATLDAIKASKPPEQDGITKLFEERRRAGT